MADTLDHVPPQCIFPGPRPSNLVTVPCCTACHRTFGKDDEYFRFVLVMGWHAGERRSARDAWPAVYRSLRRADAAGFRKGILGKLTVVDVFTPAGIYLGQSGNLEVDTERLYRVVARTVRGLFWREFGRRIPADYELRTLMVYGLEEEKREALRPLAAPIVAAPVHDIGRDVFSYRVVTDPDDVNATGWLLTFFDAVEFLGVTEPRGYGSGSPEAPHA